ncbi:Dehydrogenase/reductase SDR family member on chromosome X [Seminavis robusta]|uniref:Dehydrogenase/reductase SDR family member on chromosome X n=1 Tax=Seminavis robusta TaxID=568900 RepID=A0A9N8EUQ3_9STRA|nr:Dehydrogenase/reductase SDR family member on chromosome X [Seminavis robusta]|eukprot:Sro1875_g303060.1 Dehydrogenase/reductase SDR family member on chromosome X (325) ;mRNA; r:18883-19941
MENLAVATIWYNDFKKELPSAEGKVFAITGTTSGTGYVAARTAAEKGGAVLLLNRSSDRANKSLAKLKEEVPNGKFVPIECDLQSFESVRKAAAEIKSKYTALYCVCWNAGIMATPDQATVDGYDTQMQTNHLSHFLLTAELLPLLEKQGGDARIVNHSSGGRHMTPNKCLERKYLEKNGGNLGGSEMDVGKFSGAPFLRYFQTKLANAVFTKALHQKLQAKKSPILAICADPGMSATSLANHVDGAEDMMKGFAERVQTPEDGAMGILKGMMHPDVQSGVHYGPAGTKGPAVINEEKPYEVDPEGIKMLWETSQAATGISFEI